MSVQPELKYLTSVPAECVLSTEDVMGIHPQKSAGATACITLTDSFIQLNI